MRFLNFPTRCISAILLLVIAMSGCRPEKRILKSPPHYNFSVVLTYKLDLKLKEISGIAWDPKNNVFLAVNDEKGVVFFLDKDIMIPPTEYEFTSKGDYEDITIMNGVPYVLRSDGVIFKIIKDNEKVYGAEAGKIALSGKNDFETMYYDPGRRALIVLCKNCDLDNSKSVSAFAFYPDSIGFDSKPVYVIDAAKVDKLSPNKTKKMEPSAAAIHPVLQKLFILSSASHQLIITDLDGNVESVFELAHKLFTQPEGIAFKQNGDMYIANEGLSTRATLLKFIYNKDSSQDKAGAGKAVYNFSAPDEKMELGKQLHEISGMSYVPGKQVILAENDEKGDIFVVDFKNKNDNAGKVKFAGKGDYEDIVHTDSADYMLVSSGSIIKVKTKDSSFATEEFTLEGEKNEFETLYLGPDGHSLIMLCKQCAHEKDKKRSAYRFDLVKQQFSTDEVYSIDIDAIRKMLGDEEAEFKPSAAGINPISGKLFVVASVGKLLVIASKDGTVEQVFKLDPAMYNQPEGLTFAPNGDLYISNEGGDGVATILKFNYKK